MRKLKVFSITLVISLVFVAMAGFYGLQTAKAEDENPILNLSKRTPGCLAPNRGILLRARPRFH